MTVLYVATSKNLAGWAADVGLTNQVYKVGVAEGSADDAIKALNDDGFAGESDWRLLKQQEVDGLEEAEGELLTLEVLSDEEESVTGRMQPRP